RHTRRTPKNEGGGIPYSHLAAGFQVAELRRRLLAVTALPDDLGLIGDVEQQDLLVALHHYKTEITLTIGGGAPYLREGTDETARSRTEPLHQFRIGWSARVQHMECIELPRCVADTIGRHLRNDRHPHLQVREGDGNPLFLSGSGQFGVLHDKDRPKLRL